MKMASVVGSNRWGARKYIVEIQAPPAAAAHESVTPEEVLKRLSIAERIAEWVSVVGVPELTASYLGREYAYLTDWYKALEKARWLEDLRMAPMPEELLRYMEEPCPFSPADSGRRVKDTHLLFYVPDQVKVGTDPKKPITLRTLPDLLPGFDYAYTSDTILDGYQGSLPLIRGWYVMTKEEIIGSRNKNYEEQQALIATYPGYRMPSAPVVATILLLEQLLSGNCYLGTGPYTYTRCEEQLSSRFFLHVGGSFPGYIMAFADICFAQESFGVVGLRKF